MGVVIGLWRDSRESLVLLGTRVVVNGSRLNGDR